MSFPEKGKARVNPTRPRNVVRKAKKFTQGKVTENGKWNTRFDGECRNCGKHGHKAADCWYKQQHKSQGEGKGTGKSESNVTEISEHDSKQVEETWSPKTSSHPSSLP